MQTGRERVEFGSAIAKNCGDVLDQIVSGISDVNRMSSEISSASEEQSHGVQEISKAMGQLDQVTQQNAGASQQVSSAAEQLSSQAANLRMMVIDLVQTVQGGNGETPVQVAKVTRMDSAKEPKHTPVVAERKNVNSSLNAPSSDDSRFNSKAG